MTGVIDCETETNSVQPGVGDARLKDLVERARAEGFQLPGDGGLLAKLTRLVVESALEGERDGHLGYGKSDPAGERQRQLPQRRQASQDRADRGRPG